MVAEMNNKKFKKYTGPKLVFGWDGHNEALQWEPYVISIQKDGGWIEFYLDRFPRRNPDGELYMDTYVYLGTKLVLNAVTDMPADEHDTEEIIDILNSEFALGLY